MAGTSVCLSKGTSVLGLFHIVPCFCSGQESGPWVVCAWYPKAGPLALVAQEFQEATLGGRKQGDAQIVADRIQLTLPSQRLTEQSPKEEDPR